MRKHLLILFLACLLALTACVEKGIEVRNEWVRVAAKGENSALYFVIRNNTATDIELTGASTEIAQAGEIHSSEMAEDVMRMEMLASIPLQAGEEVTFAPGGLHIMLVNLAQDLNAGDHVEITLHFNNSPDIVLAVPVQADANAHEGHDN